MASSSSNNNNQIHRPVSNDYNPNNLSLFPDLLEPINVMEPQNLVPPPVPEMTNATRISMLSPPNSTMVMTQTRCTVRFFNDRGECLGVNYTDSAPCLYARIPERQIDAARIGGQGASDGRTMTEVQRNQVNVRAQAGHQQISPNLVDMEVEETLVNHQNSGVPLQPEVPEADGQRENKVMCPICMAAFCEATSTRCGHVFCKSCIADALKQRKQCPVCRKRLATKRDLFRIYLS